MSNNFIDDLVNNFLKYLDDNDITDYSETSKELRNLFDKLSDKILKKQDIEKQQILAPNAVIEIIDSNNGQLYRRYLELEYNENANGIRLKGEDLGGKPSEIIFLSGQSIERIAELRGEGSDSPEHH